jgi:hypothetical protein
MFRFPKGESKIARQLELTLFAHLLKVASSSRKKVAIARLFMPSVVVG